MHVTLSGLCWFKEMKQGKEILYYNTNPKVGQ